MSSQRRASSPTYATDSYETYERSRSRSTRPAREVTEEYYYEVAPRRDSRSDSTNSGRYASAYDPMPVRARAASPEYSYERRSSSADSTGSAKVSQKEIENKNGLRHKIQNMSKTDMGLTFGVLALTVAATAAGVHHQFNKKERNGRLQEEHRELSHSRSRSERSRSR